MIVKTVLLSSILVAASAFAGPVNINQADADTLAHELQGVGEKRAAAIVAYRDQHGKFTQAEQLVNVSGIGQRVYEQNKAFIRLK